MFSILSILISFGRTPSLSHRQKLTAESFQVFKFKNVKVAKENGKNGIMNFLFIHCDFSNVNILLHPSALPICLLNIFVEPFRSRLQTP